MKLIKFVAKVAAVGGIVYFALKRFFCEELRGNDE